MTAPRAVFRPPLEPAPEAVVYVIAGPAVRDSAEWARIRADLAARVKGAHLATFGDLFTSSEDYAARWPIVAGELAGAVVVPTIRGGGLVAGPVALREAGQVARAGKPVLLLTRRGLVPWEQVEVRRVKGARLVGAELVVSGGGSR
jgi:hypothetical protein